MASPLMGQAAPSPTGLLAADPNGADAAQQALSDLMGQIRNVSSEVDQIGATYPAAAPQVQQIKTLLKQMIVQAAQQAPAQTASTEALPTPGQ